MSQVSIYVKGPTFGYLQFRKLISQNNQVMKAFIIKLGESHSMIGLLFDPDYDFKIPPNLYYSSFESKGLAVMAKLAEADMKIDKFIERMTQMSPQWNKVSSDFMDSFYSSIGVKDTDSSPELKTLDFYDFFMDNYGFFYAIAVLDRSYIYDIFPEVRKDVEDAIAFNKDWHDAYELGKRTFNIAYKLHCFDSLTIGKFVDRIREKSASFTHLAPHFEKLIYYCSKKFPNQKFV